MTIYLRDLLGFYVEFERQVALEAAPGVFEERPRNVGKVLDTFRAYFGGPIRVMGLDFYDGVDIPSEDRSGDVVGQPERTDELASLVMYFERGGLPHSADILINTGRISRIDENGKIVEVDVFNRCYRRFLTLKEAFHAVLRMEFNRQGLDHPDNADTGDWMRLIEKLIYLPFAILDFDDPEYDDDLKIENAAELFAILILYPLDVIAADRQRFLSADHASFTAPEVVAALTLSFATDHLVPQRYVDMLFRWKRFDELFRHYRQIRGR